MKRALLAFLLLTSTAFAAAPDLVVKAPKQGRTGRLVKLDASESKGFKSLGWVVIPLAVEDSSMVGRDRNGDATALGFVWDEPIIVTWILVGSSPDGEIATKTGEIALAGPAPPGPVPPNPGPDPQPPTPPTPVPPTDKTGMAAVAKALAAQVTDANKAANAERLAVMFTTLGSQGAAGAFPTAKAMNEAYLAAVAALPDATYAAWKIPFIDKLKPEFNRLGVTTLAKYPPACFDIAAGLREAVK